MDFAKDKIFTLFRKIFFPTLLGMLSVAAVTAIDGIFVGHGIGSDGIAAVNICIPLLMIFTGFGLMFGIGCSVIASIALSRGKIKLARLNVTQSLLFVSFLTVILSIFMMLNLNQTAYLLGSSDSLLLMVKDYLIWFIPSLVFEMIIVISLFIIRLDGAPKLAMWYSFISSAINIVLDWLFIFPLNMGVAGAALATAISIFVGGILSIGYLQSYANTLRLYPLNIGLRGFHLFIKNISNQCYIGSSALLGEAAMAVLMFTGNHIFMRYLGDDGVGAFGIACYYAPFVFMVGNAIAQSSQPIISYNFGLADNRRVVEAEKIALLTAVVSGGLVMVLFVTIPSFLVGLFLDTATTTAQLAISGFPYFSAGFICFVINLTAIGYFQSVEKVKEATVFALFRGGVFLVPAFIFMPTLLGVSGIWLAMPVSEMLTTLFIGGYYILKRNLPLNRENLYQMKAERECLWN
ncbi:MAG: MATE family efflux transporter [Alphaproteobacteria bacterium]|nr:MATE family efflux transporter [Alphaproteobacteria bacterium]